ncbi:electron transport complex subunit RsxG [Vespertiliibacter pulmonis]|uniref:Ion-translocating oxidoreductase complex subunit G n=1 Tax=Vespertiliibacter pulmonis TaxID=1443036 RepID=A0A3N4VL28_9PAST|nr:electron transport complex subunit RsxG [Vespertiliibacter pulmonis]QLB21084.1 electron transport complex subunit RsxG [Vespertiliibacter pulmonis]RPE83816.1 electron transport complex protein RnfG [Vespertiliibacter pulmonis]
MKTSKITLRYGLILGLVALICTAISTAIYLLTQSKIEQVTAQQQRQLLLEVVPQNYFDNDLLATCKKINLPEFPFLNKIFIAKKQQEPTAYAIQATAPDGYSGNIVLLIGIDPKGTILGVRTLEHKETPGLGDKIETRVSDWIYDFSNQPFNPDNQEQWAVKKDGGQFDQFTGATITPRAVVNMVRKSGNWAIETLNSQPNVTDTFEQCN